jgi:hypothetical protein
MSCRSLPEVIRVARRFTSLASLWTLSAAAGASSGASGRSWVRPCQSSPGSRECPRDVPSLSWDCSRGEDGPGAGSISARNASIAANSSVRDSCTCCATVPLLVLASGSDSDDVDCGCACRPLRRGVASCATLVLSRGSETALFFVSLNSCLLIYSFVCPAGSLDFDWPLFPGSPAFYSHLDYVMRRVLPEKRGQPSWRPR